MGSCSCGDCSVQGALPQEGVRSAHPPQGLHPEDCLLQTRTHLPEGSTGVGRPSASGAEMALGREPATEKTFGGRGRAVTLRTEWALPSEI